MAEFAAGLVEALNALLEDERASVEMEVALASGATEFVEGAKLTAMGTEDVGFCVALRERLEQADVFVTHRINGVVFQALGAERYDDRLLVLARHQLVINDRCRNIGEYALDEETRSIVQQIIEAHNRHIAWCEQRADTFAATRLFEFRTPGAAGPSGAEDGQPPTSPDALPQTGYDTGEGSDPPDDGRQPDGLPDLHMGARRDVGRAYGPYAPGQPRPAGVAPNGDDYEYGYNPSNRPYDIP